MKNKNIKKYYRKAKKLNSSKSWQILCLILALASSIYFHYHTESKDGVILDRCVDGDTAKVFIDGKETTLRFLAIDTPESVHPTIGEEPYGKQASKFTCDLLSNAKTITLEYDNNSDKTDKYDRHLVWVFVDDNLLQELIVQEGLAEVAYLYDNYKYTSFLESAQEKAKEEKLNIWQ